MRRDRMLAELEVALPGTVQHIDGEAVLCPSSGAEVGKALVLAQRLGARLQAPGCGAREDEDRAIRLDLRRMARVLALDDTAQVVHAQAGIGLRPLEERLAQHDLTLGLEGPAPECPVGAWLARGAPGARDGANDPVDNLLAGMEAVLPDGRILALRPAPRRAVGPDLLGAFVGAHALLGVFVGVHLVARRRMPKEPSTFRFTTHESAEVARAWIRGRGVRPASARIARQGDAWMLHVVLCMSPRRASAAATVVREVAAQHGGQELHPPEAPDAATPTAVAPSGIIRALAAHLDGSGVLGG